MGGTRVVQDTAVSPTSSTRTRVPAHFLTSVERGEPLPNLAELVAHGVGVLGLRTPGEVALPVAQSLLEMSEPDVDRAAIAEVGGRASVEDQQPIVYRECLGPLAPVRVH